MLTLASSGRVAELFLVRPKSEDLLARIQRLEKRTRRLYVLLACCLSLLCMLLLMAASHGIRRKIVAHSIAVVGAAGKNAATLQATKDGFVTLSFNDLNGDLRAMLLMTPSGKPTLALFNNKVARLELGVVASAKGEEFSLQLRDAAGKPIWQPEVANGY
jgi:hypothetical protein